MTRIVGLIFFIIIIGSLIGLIFSALKKEVSGLKLMLFGLHITLLGGIIAADPNSNLGGLEYLIVFAGFIVAFMGLSKDNKKNET